MANAWNAYDTLCHQGMRRRKIRLSVEAVCHRLEMHQSERFGYLWQGQRGIVTNLLNFSIEAARLIG